MSIDQDASSSSPRPRPLASLAPHTPPRIHLSSSDDLPTPDTPSRRRSQRIPVPAFPRPPSTVTPKRESGSPAAIDAADSPRAEEQQRSPHTPESQLSSSRFRPSPPSTLARAINTALPATPSSAHNSTVFVTPPSTYPSRFESRPVELTPIRASHRDLNSDSPFHDRHSIVADDVVVGEDPFQYHSPTGRQKTMPGYQFADLAPDPRDRGEVEEMAYGEDLHEIRPIPDDRRSIYPASITMAPSNLLEHRDMQRAGSPVGTPRPRPLPDPIRPRFRRLFALHQGKDFFLHLLPATITAVAAALAQPYMSMVVGEAFQIFATYPLDLSQATPAGNTALSQGVKSTSLKLTIAGLVAVLLNWVKGALWVRHGETVVAKLREKVYVGVHAKGMEWFDLGMGLDPDEVDKDGEKSDNIGAGGLMAKFTKETDDVRTATSLALGNTIQYFFTFLFCFILAMWRSPILALVTLCTIPLVLLVQIVTQVVSEPLFASERRAFAEASTNIERATSAISTVKAHNAQKVESTRFDPIVARAKTSLIKQALVWALSYASSETLLLSTFVIGFWYGAKVVRDGRSSAGDVLTVFWAALLAATYLQMMIPQLTTLTKGKMSMASLLSVIQDLPERSDPDNPFSPATSPQNSTFPVNMKTRPMSKIHPTRCHGEFNFRSVSFAYPSRPHDYVLRDVSLFLPPGETTFIVGGSGSGKSTIAQLLLRLYKPLGGEITLDDQSISFLDEGFTRQHIAAVQQGCILFDTSIHDNVAMGLAGTIMDIKTAVARRPSDVTRDEVVEACRMAMIHDFIVSLPDGYETKLGHGGSSLSGGQKQRLAIARARIRDPTILILDEATSALDATSRVLVFDSIKRWRKNKTTIVITHDLSQIQSDDFVYVMKDGVVAEQGFRSDLVRRAPIYGNELGVFAGLAAEQAIQPIPERAEEYKQYEGSVMEMLDGDDDRRSFFGIPRPGRMSRSSSYNGLRPVSVSLSYFDILDDYTRDDKERKRDKRDSSLQPARPLSIAQKRLSWAPEDLQASASGMRNRPASRMSHVSRGSFEGTQRLSIESSRADPNSSMYLTPDGLEKDSRHLSALSYSHRRDVTLSQNLDDELKDGQLAVPVNHPSVSHSKRNIPSIFSIIFSHLPGMPHKYLLIIGILGSIAHGVITPLWASFLSKLMQIVGGGGTSPTLTTNAIIVLSLCLAQGLADFIQDYCLYSLAARWTALLRSNAFTKLLAQDKAFFDLSENAPSALCQILIKDIDDMRLITSQVIGKFVVVIVMVSLGVIWAMVVQWRLTLIGLAVGPVLGVVVVLNEGLIGKAEVRNKAKREAVAKTFYESVANVRGIRAMALDDTFLEKFRTDARSAKTLGKRDAWVIAVGGALSAGLIFFVQALMNWAGMLLMLKGYMNYMDMLQVYNLILFSLTFGSQMLDFIPAMTKAKVAATDYARLHALTMTTLESSGELRFPITGNVTFSNVSFSYPTQPDVPILHDMSFTLTPGSCVAIVGPSGSGKSTIAALLQRLYEPTSGKIMLGKHPLSSADVKWLRNHIAVVSQSANLFDATVAENISYGSDVPIGEVHRAAKAANIHDFIVSLPDGYDTNLGENASLISGGQAQRLQIARALVRRSNILILDECTSALDVDNARAVLDTIVKIKSRTTIFITHSLEAMRRCDRIICLGEGRIADNGSFEELMARRGVFAQLMRTGEWE